MSVWKYADGIDHVPEPCRLSLGEGETPVIMSRRIGRQHGIDQLAFKLESTNPTGSFKDRYAAVAISNMLALGKTRCLATSSGNTGASLAAYSAAADLVCDITVVETAPAEKLSQMRAYGANVKQVAGFGTDPDITDSVFAELEREAQRPDSSLEISAFRYSPVGMSGVRTISYELAEDADTLPDHVFCPAGGGGLALAVAQGFLALAEAGTIDRVPQVYCVQPEGNDTIASALAGGASCARPVDCTTRISGLQVASVIDGDAVIDACRRTGGTGVVVSDEEVWEVQARLAREEGIFTEPAGAVSVAGALRSVEKGLIHLDHRVVCLVTGTGFKDAASIKRMADGNADFFV